MITEALIEQMVSVAIEVPFDHTQLQQHQRFAGDRILLCYIADHAGYLTVRSFRPLEGPEKVRLAQFLARWYGEMIKTDRAIPDEQVRFIFDHPLTGSRIPYIGGPPERRAPPFDQWSRTPRASRERSSAQTPASAGPRWVHLAEDRCHICHRELTDPVSLRVRIGSVCRSHIEVAEGRSAAMWDEVTPADLEALWSQYNIYSRARREE